MANYENPPRDTDEIILEKNGYIDPESKESLTESENDRKNIEAYVDPYLEEQRKKNVEQKTKEIHEALELRIEKDSTLKSEGLIPLEDMIIWVKPEIHQENTEAQEESPEVVSVDTNEQSAKKVTGIKKILLGLGFGLTAVTGLAANPREKNPSDTMNTSVKERGMYKENRSEVGIKLRQDWNDYVDWLDAQGLKGSPLLDKNDLGGAMIDRYKKEHPGTSVSRETIDDIQKEFEQYKEWIIEEIKAGRAQLAPGTTMENLMTRLSKIDNIAGQYTTRHKFADAYLKTFYDGKLVEVKNLGFAKIKNDGKTINYPTDIAKDK